MAIKTGEYLKNKDVYIDYPFEEVMFRRDHLSGHIYKKFYREAEIDTAVPYNNRLYNDALLYGNEITLEEYIKGKVSPDEQS